MDICFSSDIPENSKFSCPLTVYGRWVNMGYTNSWLLPTGTTLITVKNRDEWEKCTTPGAKCLRYGIWEQL